MNPVSEPWTATTNATWLHLSPANQSGTGSTNVVFSYDANPGATRSGTLTIAGQTLTVTQAGSTYVAAGTCDHAWCPRDLNDPYGVAVDGAGNVYIADTDNNAIKKWTAANNTVTTLVSSGLKRPQGVAVDGAGNVYIADTGNNAIKEWTAANSNVTTLVSSGLNRSQWRGGGRRGQCLYRRHRQQRDQGVDGGQQQRDHTGVLGTGLSCRRGGGRRGQCLYRRHRQQRDQGVDGGQQQRDHVGVLGIGLSLWRGGGRRGQCLYRRHRQSARSRSGRRPATP